MKSFVLIAALLLSCPLFAFDMDAAQEAAKQAGTKAMEKGKEVFQACKKEHVEFCKAYFEIEPLKECLSKNKAKLSPGCKKAVGI